MTNKERKFLSLGLEYAEGIEFAKVISLPNGRMIQKTSKGWVAQPHNDNYWREFTDLYNAVVFALDKKVIASEFADKKAIPL